MAESRDSKESKKSGDKSEKGDGKLKRTLGLGECIFFGVGSILGAGIYALVGKVAGHGGNFMWLSFLIAMVTALMTAFSYAELSSTFPESGGEYVYAKNAIGKKVAVFLGIVISMNGIVVGAAVALGFAGYFAQLLNVSELLASLGVICLLFLVNVWGIRQSSVINIIFTLIEAGGLGFVIYTALPEFGSVNYFEMPPAGITGIMLGAALSFFAYIGFEEIVKLAEETKEPEKNVPRALFTASAIVAVVYVLVAIAAVSAMPWEKLADSKSPLADIVSGRFGRAGVITISIIALFATSNTILSNMLGASRVLLDMSEENRFLKILSYVSPKRKTPVAALIFIGVAMAVFALIGKIELVAMIANFFIYITFLLVNASVIMLRRKDKDLKRPYKIPFNINDIPVPSMLGILLTLVLMGYSIYGLTISAL